jgi:hypothetical protein
VDITAGKVESESVGVGDDDSNAVSGVGGVNCKGVANVDDKEPGVGGERGGDGGGETRSGVGGVNGVAGQGAGERVKGVGGVKGERDPEDTSRTS